MFMTTHTGRRLATAALGVTGMLLALAAPATAAPQQSTGTISITAQRLVMEPTDRGYVGTLQATVTNKGSSPARYSLTITDPTGDAFTSIEPLGGCFYQGQVRNRLVTECPGGNLEPGGSQTVTLGFKVLTPARDHAMIALGGRIDLSPEGSSEAVDSAGFATLFRSTTGSLRNPKPYAQSVKSDMRITGAGATLTRQPDGSFLGRMPVTVRYGNDAPHFALNVEATLPGGVVVHHIEPQDMPSSWTWFTMPGGKFMAGEERTVDVILTAPAETVLGDLGTGSFTVSVSYIYGVSVEDVDPTDDTTSFTLTAAEAS